MKMYKVHVFAYILASMFGGTNAMAMAMMGIKMRSKFFKYGGLGAIVGCVVFIIIGNVCAGAAAEVFFMCGVILCTLPSPIVWIGIPEYQRRMKILWAVDRYQVSTDQISLNMDGQIEQSIPKGYRKSAEALYGKMAIAILAEIHKQSNDEQQKKIEQADELQRQRKEEAERRKEDLLLKREEMRRKSEERQLNLEMTKEKEAEQKEEELRLKREAERRKKEEQQLQRKEERGGESVTISEAEMVSEKAPVDINTCDEITLSQIPGVGLIFAKKAMSIRMERGRFASVNEFIQLVGIRENNVEKVKSRLVCYEAEKIADGNQNRGRVIDL